MPTVLPPRPAPFQPQRGLEGIHLAVELGDLEAVKRYLEETPGRVGEDTSRGVTPLHMAVAYNAGEIARLLVEKGAPVNARTDNGMTPLHYAAMTGRADFVRMLLDAGAHEGLRNVRGNTPADLARRARVTEVVNILEPPAPEEAEDDPLLEAHAFIRGGDLENLEAWAASNPEDLEALDNEGRTLLMFAAVEDQPIIAEWLLDQGVDPGKRGSEAMTALHWAAKHGSLAVIEQLLDHGADIDAEDGEYRTALFYALDNGQSEAASLLIERGASVDGRDDGLTPLHLAAAYRNVDLVERLVEQGADPRARTRDGKTPWDYAQEAGFSDVARILADSDPGFEPDAPAEEDGGAVEDDEQPLDTVPPEEDAPVSPAERLANAFTEGDESVVLELLGQNRELASWRCEQGLTPLHHAAIVGMGEVAEYLLTEGTDPNARNAAGQTPLHYAEVFQRGAIADALIAAGADPETGDVHGDTPKQLARDFDRRYNRTGQDDAGPRPLTRVRGEDDLAFMVRQGVRAMNTGREDELFAMLDEEPAMLSAPDRRGQTLLHHAVQEENTPVTTQLLERGAPVNAEDSQGRRPVFYAVELGRLDLVELLREHGAEFAPADDNLTALHVAVAARDYGMTAYLLDAGLSVNERTRGGKSPLDYATELGYAELADLLAARGAHVDAPNPRGTSGVFSAAAQRSLADF